MLTAGSLPARLAQDQGRRDRTHGWWTSAATRAAPVMTMHAVLTGAMPCRHSRSGCSSAAYAQASRPAVLHLRHTGAHERGMRRRRCRPCGLRLSASSGNGAGSQLKACISLPSARQSPPHHATRQSSEDDTLRKSLREQDMCIHVMVRGSRYKKLRLGAFVDHSTHARHQDTGHTRQESRADPQRSAASDGDAWRLLGALFLCGSLLGPPLDGIHTNVGLLQYDSLPLELGAPSSLLDRHAVARMLQLHLRLLSIVVVVADP